MKRTIAFRIDDVWLGSWGNDLIPLKILEIYGRNFMAGCGNHGCWIEKPVGQGTNGRCHCLSELGKENEQVLKRKLAELDKLTQERELLRMTAAMFLEASALYHQNMHDIVALRKYGEIRAKFRDVFGVGE